MKRGPLIPIIAGLGYVFLYAPIVWLVVFSFNDNRLVTVWGGFTTRWYGELFQNEKLLAAAVRSLEVATISATVALVLGTLCAVSLVRFRRFRGKSVLAATVAAPLVMPDVITGLAMLLLFATTRSLFHFPAQNGIPTIIIAHSVICMAYVTVVVQSRLSELDLSLEEAAMDLGATPWTTFRTITLPLIAPAVGSGWLLAFTLSLDDLVIASFTTGPSATTLPMVIFSSVRLGVSPQINALATLLLVFVALAILVAGRILARTRSAAAR